MRSIRFGVLAIAICGLIGGGAAIQVGIWGGAVGSLAERQEAISNNIIMLRNAGRAMLDMETGQRGYLLTGQDEYLQPYENGSRNFEPPLERLTDTFQDDPTIRAQIAKLLDLGRAKASELKRTIELRRSGDLAAALDIVRSGEGKHIMDEFGAELRPLLDQFRAARSGLAVMAAQKFRETMLLGAFVLVLILVLLALAIVWLSNSIARMRELQKQLELETMHDALTNLPNRRYLDEWLEIALAGVRRSQRRLVLLYFDLDGFKCVNDRFGHEAGDRVLMAIAARLRRGLRNSDFIARLGGDEFVAVLPDAPSEPDLSRLVARFEADLARAPIPELADGEISASIGVAACGGGGGTDTAEALIAAADRAMYEVKQRHREARHQYGRRMEAEPAAVLS